MRDEGTAHPSFEADEHEALFELIGAGWTTQIIRAACLLNLPDLLRGDARTTSEMAQEARLHAPALRRLLLALVTLGLCRQDDDDAFALTPRGALLRDDSPQSLRAWALLVGGTLIPRAVELDQTVRTGVSYRVRHSGTEDFAHLEADRAAAALFNQAMNAITGHVGGLVAQRIDFSGVQRIVDVGGGTGALLAAILPHWPLAHGVLFDLAHAADGAKALLQQAGVGDRCEWITGSFFDGVPAGGDCYLLKSVLHNWDDERCVRILAQCHAAMAAGARVLVIERVLGERPGTTPRDRAAARSDLNMMLALSGRERRLVEFDALFAAANLERVGIAGAVSEYSVIEARALRR